MGIIERGVHILRKEGLIRTLRLSLEYILFELSNIVEYVKFLIMHPFQLKTRINIFKRFYKIHKSVPCAHSFAELLHIAEEIISISSKIEVDIIECSVYKGVAPVS